jgi:uncharacterized protein (DUF305 family)
MSRQPSALALLAACLTVGLGIAGCGGDDGDEAAPPTDATPSAVPFDRSFIDAMVPHHESAIEMANAAKEAGLEAPELIRVADDIIESQRAEIDQMLGWREEWFGSREIDPEGAAGLGLSAAAMGMEHDAEDIEGADDVDRAFAEAMIPHHEGAIEMAELARERGQHEEIKALAEDIIEAQAREIEILEPHAEGHHGS